MIFKRKIKYFCINHSWLILFFVMAYYSYFIFDHPDVWTHQETYFKRILGYYVAPYILLFSLVFPFYQWFKCRRVVINFNDEIIHKNNKLIDISAVNEIYKRYIPLTKSFEYTFYEVVLMEHRKKVIIPMFFIPNSISLFEKELNEFCANNNVKLVDSRDNI